MKKTKKEVHYRDGTALRMCDNCSMFRPAALVEVLQEADDLCTDVEGSIQADGICDIWDKRK